jgi:hypothetical protein
MTESGKYDKIYLLTMAEFRPPEGGFRQDDKGEKE